MPVISKNVSRALTLRQKEGRAVNAIAELLRKTLSVPHIYLEPHSPAVDVLAVDRAGSGDLHGVEIKLGDFAEDRIKNPVNLKALKKQRESWRLDFKRRIERIRQQLMSLPAHYRYLALPQSACDLVLGELRPVLYSPDGIGRIGIIAISGGGEEPPRAEIVIAPERFRVDAAKLGNIEKKLLEKVRPDIEVRI